MSSLRSVHKLKKYAFFKILIIKAIWFLKYAFKQKQVLGVDSILQLKNLNHQPETRNYKPEIINPKL